MHRRERAVIVVLREPQFDTRQWEILLDYCQVNHLEPTSLVHRDPAAACQLVRDGCADVVVAPFLDVHRILANAGVPVRYIRQATERAASRTSPQAKLVRSMLERGGSIELVAQLLDMRVGAVRALAEGEAQNASGCCEPTDRSVPVQRGEIRPQRTRPVPRPGGHGHLPIDA